MLGFGLKEDLKREVDFGNSYYTKSLFSTIRTGSFASFVRQFSRQSVQKRVCYLSAVH